MPTRKNWTREELFIAMNLYSKIPFGHFYHRNPIIIEVSKCMDRTASSLSMKLCNLASLDPACHQRGVVGLQGSSKMDREIWNEFQESWSISILKSEELFNSLTKDSNLESLSIQQQDVLLEQITTEEETQIESIVKLRRGQNLFRKAVLRQFKSEVQQCLMMKRILHEGYDSQEIFSVDD